MIVKARPEIGFTSVEDVTKRLDNLSAEQTKITQAKNVISEMNFNFLK